MKANRSIVRGGGTYDTIIGNPFEPLFPMSVSACNGGSEKSAFESTLDRELAPEDYRKRLVVSRCADFSIVRGERRDSYNGRCQGNAATVPIEQFSPFLLKQSFSRKDRESTFYSPVVEQVLDDCFYLL